MLPIRDNIPTDRRPIVTVGLIIVNTVIYFYQFSLGPRVEGFIYSFGMIPNVITGQGAVLGDAAIPPELTMLTSMFLHGSWLHLLGNMLYLWIFGNNVEDKLGHFVFIFFYVACGVVAGVAHLVTAPNSQIPTVGASGAIAGVLGAYLVKFPRAKVLTLIWLGFFVRMVHIPAIVVLGFWFLFQLMWGLPTLGMEQSSGVAYFAHIGGFVAGMILFPVIMLFKRTI